MRKLFPVLEKGFFFNHAATAPVSYATIDRMKALCDEMREPLGTHFYQWLGILEETRRLLAEHLNAHPSEIAFTQNTSSSLSIIARCIDFKPGDRILIPRDEFPSNRYVWQNLKSLGVECTFFDIQNDRPLLETLEKLDLTNVRLITLSLVSYLSGKKHAIKSFGEFCRKHQIFSCVDAIQAVGTFPIDLQEASIDFLAGGAQKWLLGPIGCGYFYIRKSLIEKVRVPLVGWTSVRYPESFEIMELDFAADATRFEPGLPNLASIGGFNQSLRELGRIGWNTIYSLIEINSRYLLDGLKQIEGLKLMVDNPQDLGAIVTCELPQKINHKKLLSELAKKGIVVTAREHYLRISPHFYNTSADLDKLLTTLDSQVENRKVFFPEPSKKNEQNEKWILLNGATGILGQEIARVLAEKGYNISGIGRNTTILKELKDELKNFEPVTLDLTDKNQLSKFFQTQTKKYVGLINCSGIAEPELIESMDPEKLFEMFQVNFFAPVQFMQQFISNLCADEAIGILNIVSASGRCGYPLLGGYGASNSALWTLSESLHRELCKKELHVTTYVSPQLHSRMQKRIGRASLRYFKMKGIFNYSHAEEVARHAVDAFLSRKELVISRKNRLRMILNAISPHFISRKISRVWYPEKEADVQ